MNKIIIGVSGAARAGKDTVANILVEDYGFIKYSFADPLKRAAAEMFGLPVEHFYDDDIKDAVNNYWGISPRLMLQKLGTEGGRQLFRDDIWIMRANKFFVESEAPRIVVPDVRFPNEAEYMKTIGAKLVNVKRPNGPATGVPKHASEAGYPEELNDVTLINDRGGLEDFQAIIRRTVDDIL